MMKWMDAAWAELGQTEVSGHNANPEIIGYFKAAGRQDVLSDEVAWCAAFAWSCLVKAGITPEIEPQRRLLANSYLKAGTPIDTPRAGAICVLSRGSDPSQGHVGFVVGWTDDDVVLLGGNQSNSVSVAHFPKSRIRGLRWPEEVTPSQLDQCGSRITTTAARSTWDAGKTTAAPFVPAPPAFDLAAPSPDAILGKATALQGSVETLMAFSTFLSSRWPWVMGAVALYYGARVVWSSRLIRSWRADDASTGKTPANVSRPAGRLEAPA